MNEWIALCQGGLITGMVGGNYRSIGCWWIAPTTLRCNNEISQLQVQWQSLGFRWKEATRPQWAENKRHKQSRHTRAVDQRLCDVVTAVLLLLLHSWTCVNVFDFRSVSAHPAIVSPTASPRGPRQSSLTEPVTGRWFMSTSFQKAPVLALKIPLTLHMTLARHGSLCKCYWLMCPSKLIMHPWPLWTLNMQKRKKKITKKEKKHRMSIAATSVMCQ